jgi:hypothetical protein
MPTMNRRPMIEWLEAQIVSHQLLDSERTGRAP